MIHFVQLLYQLYGLRDHFHNFNVVVTQQQGKNGRLIELFILITKQLSDKMTDEGFIEM
jgi:hypothetical protein